MAFEDCRYRSFMLVNIDPVTGMTATGHQASEPDTIPNTNPPIKYDVPGNYIGRVFDQFTVAPPLRWHFGH